MDKNLTLGAALLALGAGAFILSKFKPNINSQSTPLPPYHPPGPTFHGDLDGAPPTISTSGGTETLLTEDQIPVFKGQEQDTLNHDQLSLALLRLNPGGVREPHWHLNANEILYCSNGTAAMTIFLGSPNLVHDSFAVTAGDIVFVPKGFFHHIDNIGSVPLKMLIGYNNSKVQTEGLSGAIGVSGPTLLNKTFGTSFFDLVGNIPTTDIGISMRPPDAPIPVLVPLTTSRTPINLTLPVKRSMLVEATPLGTVSKQIKAGRPVSITTQLPTQPIAVNQISRQSKFLYPLEFTTPALNSAGGSDTTSDLNRFPILKGGGLAIFTIHIRPLGVREPHWHPNASELHYVNYGTTNYFVGSPGGAVESGTITKGQFFLAPTGYLHYFENPDPLNPLHIVAIFTSDNPADVGISGGMSAYSNSVLGAILNKSPSLFSLLPRFKTDEGIVGGFRS